MFQKLKNCANDYVAVMTCFDIALLKTCVLAVGMLLGLAIAPRRKKVATWTACLVFVGTYIPLMYKFIPFLKEAFMTAQEEQEDEDFNFDTIEEVEVECYE